MNDRSKYTEVGIMRDDLRSLVETAAANARVTDDFRQNVEEVADTASMVAANCSWQPVAECGCPAYIAIFGDTLSDKWRYHGFNDPMAFDFGTEFDRLVREAFHLGADDIVLRVCG